MVDADLNWNETEEEKKMVIIDVKDGTIYIQIVLKFQSEAVFPNKK